MEKWNCLTNADREMCWKRHDIWIPYVPLRNAYSIPSGLHIPNLPVDGSTFLRTLPIVISLLWALLSLSAFLLPSCVSLQEPFLSSLLLTFSSSPLLLIYKKSVKETMYTPLVTFSFFIYLYEWNRSLYCRLLICSKYCVHMLLHF